MVGIKLTEEIKAAIMLEVNSQLKPVIVKIDKLALNQRSLYRNGTGGAPGYLERARAEDEKWQKELKEEYKNWRNELKSVVNTHGDQIAFVVDYVKTHNQRDVEEQGRQLKKEERWRFWIPRLWTMAGGFIVTFVGGIIWALHKAAPWIQLIVNHYANVSK
jgi:hypothetical protein